MGKKFKDLDLNNAFLFAATMSDPDTCRLVLEIILGEELPPVTVHTEHTVLFSADFRSVRFDVYATDELQVNYNIEAQRYGVKDLPKRSRFHQAEMDVMSIKPGQKFEDLKPAYVIFVCTFDPFGKGLYKYTFENACQECGIPLEDGAKRIFLNTKGTNADEVSLELQHFLSYVQQSTDEFVADVNDANISKIHERVTRVKEMKDLEEMFMTGEEWLEEMKAEGLAEGLAEGRTQGLAEGRISGIAQSVITVISRWGNVPADIEAKIMSESEEAVLLAWVKSASEASSLEEFIEKM
ncbi:MAG: Rpn family recombination-promoting nuclease/putative transposase [Lachnospira sp.]|nr:Rpn family recombination-promoting nuclease/putative transposase [Lachnospira sp.]